MRVPLKRTLSQTIAAVALDATATTILGKAPFAGVVASIEFVPNAAITGIDTDTRKVEVINKGQAGAGTTVVGELQFDDDIDAVAFDAKTIPLSETEANLEVAAGDVLAVVSTTVGDGLADPGGMYIVQITRNDDA